MLLKCYKIVGVGSVTKHCGSFFERFPEAEAGGVVAKCNAVQCDLRPPPDAFQIFPVRKLKCHQKKWKIGMKPIPNNFKIEAVFWQTYK